MGKPKIKKNQEKLNDALRLINGIMEFQSIKLHHCIKFPLVLNGDDNNKNK